MVTVASYLFTIWFLLNYGVLLCVGAIALLKHAWPAVLLLTIACVVTGGC